MSGRVDLGRVRELFAAKVVARKAALDAADPEAGEVGLSPWRAFLVTYGAEWDGKLGSWGGFRAWIELFAGEKGVSGEAAGFLAAAEAVPDEEGRIEFFGRHGVDVGKRKAAGSTPEDLPDADAEGRPVEVVLSTVKGKDGDEEFYWVRVDGEVGKLYLKGRVFRAEENEELGGLPATDRDGRRITAVQPRKPGEDLTVRVGDMWGRLNPTTREFTGLRPDESAFADWSAREPTEDGYTEGGTEFAGSWHRPWAGQSIYLLRRANGREWARGGQVTAVEVQGTRQVVEAVVRDWARPYEDLL